ncbi:hypothetical protein CSA56_06680 [candidate division KSB3 bacterium]|uniref:Periplasmic chaperone PpiD n=1 Tax=candidate division KSB3 bacterium TaxID=2044937 RepID=A0A2G6KGM0_9BACT|nr:MAG: hypothetical protein CSA56_06680 [candidate division KSB3 bacterium]
MLDVMRQNIKSLRIFLWLVIAAFIGTIFFVWGQGGRHGGPRGQNVVAWVNGDPISYTSFENSFRNVYEFYKQIYGNNLSPEMLQNLQLEQVALNQLTQKTLLVQEAKARHLQVSDKELVRTIQEIPQFHSNDRFDPAVYKNVLSRARITPQEFEVQTEETLLSEKLEYLIKQTVRISDREVLDDYTAQNEMIEVEGLLVKADSFLENVEYTDDDVQAYYDVHKADFTTPPRVKIQYIHFDPQTIKDEITPTDDDILAYYEAHEAEFNKGKEVHARHILFRVPQDAEEDTVNEIQTKAEGILQQLRDGANFMELAQEHSEDPGSAQNGGDLGFFTKGSMVPEFEEAAFALAAGDISELVKTQFGFHIIKVEETREDDDPYGTAKPTIVDRLKLAQAKDLARERAEISYEDLLDIDNLEEVAAKDELNVNVSDFFAQGEPIDEKTTAVPQIQQIAFTLNAEQKFSQPIETPLGYYIVEFLEQQEPYVPELADIKEAVTEAVRKEKAEELAKTEIEAIQQALADGITWENVAENYPVEIITPSPFSRRQQYINEARGESEEFVKTAFALRDGEISKPIELGDDYCVIRVKERTDIDMAAFEEEKAALTEKLLQQKQETAFRQYIDELQQKADIKYVENLFS